MFLMALGAGASSGQEGSVVSGQSSSCGYYVNLVKTTAWALVGYEAWATSSSVNFHFRGLERLMIDISMYLVLAPVLRVAYFTLFHYMTEV